LLVREQESLQLWTLKSAKSCRENIQIKLFNSLAARNWRREIASPNAHQVHIFKVSVPKSYQVRCFSSMSKKKKLLHNLKNQPKFVETLLVWRGLT
jgi:Holliday junction resolvase RusA-like endonuclease